MIKVICIVGLILLLGGFVIVFSNEEKQDVKDKQTDSITIDSDLDKPPEANQNSQRYISFPNNN